MIESQIDENSRTNLDGIPNEESKVHNVQKTFDSQIMATNVEENETEEIVPPIITKDEQKLDVVKTKQFNVFARKYILQRILHVLHSEKDDTKYGVYKKYLIRVEGCTLDVNSGQNSNDLFVALKNAYHLHFHSNLIKHQIEPNISSVSWQIETRKYDNMSIEPSFEKDIDVINSMIQYVGEEKKYHEYLNILCDIN